jgi:hypothetical protein
VNQGHNHEIERANTFFENEAQLKFLGTTMTNQNQKNIKKVI